MSTPKPIRAESGYIFVYVAKKGGRENRTGHISLSACYVLVMGWKHSPKIHEVKLQPPLTHYVNVFEGGTLKEVIKVKWDY